MRLSKHLRTESSEEQYHQPDPHAGCEDDPCDDCHRDSGGSFCAECGEQVATPIDLDFCSASCSAAWTKSHTYECPDCAGDGTREDLRGWVGLSSEPIEALVRCERCDGTGTIVDYEAPKAVLS